MDNATSTIKLVSTIVPYAGALGLLIIIMVVYKLTIDTADDI